MFTKNGQFHQNCKLSHFFNLLKALNAQGRLGNFPSNYIQMFNNIIKKNLNIFIKTMLHINIFKTYYENIEYKS